jgi:hypothetical protein
MESNAGRARESNLRIWKRKAARWAAVYLCAAGVLLAIAGSEFATPSAEERAAEVEQHAGAELESVLATASGVADSWARSDTHQNARRAVALETALAAAATWANRVAAESANEAPDFAARAHEIAAVMPDGLSLSVHDVDGSPVFEAGGTAVPTSGESLVAPLREGLSVAVAWADDRPGESARATAALRDALAASTRVGLGLYALTGENEPAVAICPRPVPGASIAQLLGASSSFSSHATGDLETGRMLTVRCRSKERGWTLVAERFLPPSELAAGGESPVGMIALSALGIVAAAAFAHAIRGGLTGRGASVEAITRGPVLPARVEQMRPGDSIARTEPEPIQLIGSSLLRLRESLGESCEGPDLAVTARSPILRALSTSLKSEVKQTLPRDVLGRSEAA